MNFSISLSTLLAHAIAVLRYLKVLINGGYPASGWIKCLRGVGKHAPFDNCRDTALSHHTENLRLQNNNISK
jgi:hypothetical protein